MIIKVILFDREKLEYIEENSILIINYEKAIVRPELKRYVISHYF